MKRKIPNEIPSHKRMVLRNFVYGKKEIVLLFDIIFIPPALYRKLSDLKHLNM